MLVKEATGIFLPQHYTFYVVQFSLQLMAAGRLLIFWLFLFLFLRKHNKMQQAAKAVQIYGKQLFQMNVKELWPIFMINSIWNCLFHNSCEIPRLIFQMYNYSVWCLKIKFSMDDLLISFLNNTWLYIHENYYNTLLCSLVWQADFAIYASQAAQFVPKYRICMILITYQIIRFRQWTVWPHCSERVKMMSMENRVQGYLS